jgi:hypothetical protein
MNAIRNHAKTLSWTLILAFAASLLPVSMAHAAAPRGRARTHAGVRASAIRGAVGNFGTVGYNPYSYGYSDYDLYNSAVGFSPYVVTTPMTNLLTPIATTPMTNLLSPYPSPVVGGALFMAPY